MFGNCETEAKAAKLPRHRSVSLFERRKQGSQSLGFNSNAVVRNFEMETATVVVKRADGDLSARCREFHGIIDQVPKNLLKPNTISRDVIFLRLEFRRDL